MLTPQEQQIELALQSNLIALKEAFFDLLAGLVLFVIALVSLIHAVVRLAFAGLGLVLWALALLNIGLYRLRAFAVSRSASSLHRR